METEIRFSRVMVAIGLLSVATLAFETALTRFLAVAHFYHFAFLIVSLALLGFGASGTLLSIFPQIRQHSLEDILSYAGIIFALSIWVTFAVVNWLPFDSYSIAWDRRQLLYFTLYYFSLSIPFLISGLGLGAALAVIKKKHNQVYAANLVGSGLGVLVAPALLALSGILGVIIVSWILGLGCWFVIKRDEKSLISMRIGIGLVCILSLAGIVVITVANNHGTSPIGINLSPYKGLSYARQYPGAEHLFGKWKAASRVDVMANVGIRKLPGLSYRFEESPPLQYGLSIDADTLQPITLSKPDMFTATKWLPEWWPFSVKTHPDVLVLNPGAGFGILQAVAGGSGQVQTIIEDRLVMEAVRETAPDYSMFNHPDVKINVGNQRAFLERTDKEYDLIFMPLTDPYQPVTNGAYSISENYQLTSEGIAAALDLLTEDGIFISSRWLQNPPSEGVRLVSTIVAALGDEKEKDFQELFVIYRGIQTITVVVKPSGWENTDLRSLRNFLERCRFDLVWAPDLALEEINRWNKLQTPLYFQAVQEILTAADRRAFYQSYPYDIKPPTDGHPYFFHFFTWSQAPQVIKNMGKTWQPFGGSGFFMLFFLLALVTCLSGVLILIPHIISRKDHLGFQSANKQWVLMYFAFIGIGFMFLEIPLINQWRLFLKSPIAAFSAVVGILLVTSGVGSIAADQDWKQKHQLILLIALMGMGFVFFSFFKSELILGLPSWSRYLVCCLGLSPVGFLMGTFFPRGISWIKSSYPEHVPWAWAINGSTSVIASIITAILSLLTGYGLVMILGGLCYLAAWLILEIQGA